MNEQQLILIVDDDTDWSDILATSLRKNGYQTHVAPDTTTAKEWLSSNQPALVLLDIMMPDGNGLDMCQWIRARPEFQRLPIIIDSGVKDNETLQLALKLGATDFLHKPVHLDVLKRKVKKLLAPKP